MQDILIRVRAALALIFAMLALANQVQRAVGGDAIQPGGEAGARFVPVDLAISPQESLLHHVLGVLFIRRDSISQPEDGAAMLFHQQPKRVVVTRPRAFHGAAGFRFHPSFRLRFLLTVRRIGWLATRLLRVSKWGCLRVK